MFMSPQVLLSSPGGYTSKCDIWSLGVVFYYMLFGEGPYGLAATVKQIQLCMASIQKGAFTLPHANLMSEATQKLIMKCLAYEEKNRPSAR